MIVGIGTDLVSIERMEKACENQAFFTRIFTERECQQAGGKAHVLAGNFAVKEAVAKALGTGFRSFMPIDVEVLRDDLGKPYVELKNGAQKLAESLGVWRFHVSISDEQGLALAFAVAEGKERRA